MSSDDQSRIEGPAPLDTVFDLFSHRLRRSLLIELRGHDRPQAVADIAKTIAVQQQEDASLEDMPDDEPERIHTALYHVHLPKLVDAGAIAFDQDQNAVTLTSQGEQLCSRVEQITEPLAQAQAEDD